MPVLSRVPGFHYQSSFDRGFPNGHQHTAGRGWFALPGTEYVIAGKTGRLAATGLNLSGTVKPYSARSLAYYRVNRRLRLKSAAIVHGPNQENPPCAHDSVPVVMIVDIRDSRLAPLIRPGKTVPHHRTYKAGTPGRRLQQRSTAPHGRVTERHNLHRHGNTEFVEHCFSFLKKAWFGYRDSGRQGGFRRSRNSAADLRT
jgi:hypothetical protein